MAQQLAATGAIARSLEACLGTAFGPLGCDRFVRSRQKPGEVVVTSSGNTVLQTLALSNPIAQVIADGASKLQGLAGDGSTTLILLLAELLRQAEAWVGAGTAPDSRQCRLLRFRRAVMQLKQEQLEPLLLPLFRAHVVSVRTCDTEQLFPLAKSVVRTIVAPTLGPAAPVDTLVELLLEAILVPWCEAMSTARMAATSTSEEPAWLKPGCRVIITGLRSAEQHNGVAGVIESYRPKGQRWAVRLLSGPNRGHPLAVRASNLCATSDSDNTSDPLDMVVSLKEHLCVIRRLGPPVAAVQGAGLSSSSVVDGVLLCGSFHPHHEKHVGVAAEPHGRGNSGGSVRFILLGVALENTSTESGLRRTTLEVSEGPSDSVENELEQWSSCRLRRLVLDLVHTCGVELIVSALRVSDALAAVCSEIGVAAVQCVEKEELQMLAHAAGAVVAAEIPYLPSDGDAPAATEMSTDPRLSWTDRWGGGSIGTASSVKCETVGGKSFVHFRLLHPRPLAQPAAKTLVLRGPGKALLGLHARLLDRCITALDACCCRLPVSALSSNGHGNSDDSASKERQQQPGIAYNPLSSFIPAQAKNEEEGEVFAVVPGGMVIELGMAAALERWTVYGCNCDGDSVADAKSSSNIQDLAVAVPGRTEETLGLRALHAALLAVARRLHANAVGGVAALSTGGGRGGGSNKTRHERRIAMKFLEAMGKVARVDGSKALGPKVIRSTKGEDGSAAAAQQVRGGFRSDLSTGCVLETAHAASICESGVVESAAGKWGVVCVALEIAAQLLGVDAVLSVKHKPEGNADRDRREAEEADLIGVERRRVGDEPFVSSTGLDSDSD